MRRGYSRNTLAAIASLVLLLIAGGHALAGQTGAATDETAGVVQRLATVDAEQLPSQTGRYDFINVDEASLDIIIGSDDRQQVTNTSNFPNSAVTYIEAWNEDEEIAFLCTAAFVGPNVLLTAAHCLWIPELGGFPDGVAVVPGMNGDDTPFGFDFASEIWVPDGWISASGDINQGYPFDYGLIVLESDDLSAETGEFTVGVMGTATLNASDFGPSTAGYPGDKPWGTQWFGSSDSFVEVMPELLVHDIDAFQGQSGSPVWRADDLTVVGVLSFETYDDNYARRITADVLSDLNSACNALECDINQTAGGADPTPTSPPSPTATTPSPTETAAPTSTVTATNPPASTAPAEPTVPATGTLPPAQGDTGAFERTWRWTDDPVESGLVSRTWMWGPAFTEIMVEPYDESGGYRTVIYHEKSRMEITNPGGDPLSIWYVTNGLIAQELVTGKLQLGDSRFETRNPAEINVAGDANDPNGPVYASFLGLLDAAPYATGSTVTATVDRAGTVGSDPGLAAHGVTAAHFAPETNHTVASVFWNFMNASGLVYDGGGYREDLLFQNPYFATGLPISEPYWATVRVGGTERTVLVQVFERRVLTYTPGNPPGWDVEAGNVGLHYYEWRYTGDDPPAAPEPPAVPTPEPPADPTPEPPADDMPDMAVCLDAVESEFLALINDYRVANGLAPLANSATLNVAAYDHSRDMSDNGYFSHTSQNGDSPWDRMAEAGYDYNTAQGENIAYGYPTAEEVFEGWRDSPGHNTNMLHPDFEVIGIGYVSDGHYWTTAFGGHVDAAPAC